MMQGAGVGLGPPAGMEAAGAEMWKWELKNGVWLCKKARCGR